MSRPTAGQIALITTGAVVTGCLGYAVYFDYMRRNSTEFRKGIKSQHKKIAAAAEARAKAEKEKNSKALRAALVEIERDVPPVSPEQQEAYFQEQVAQGERLAVMGPEHQVDSAAHFFRALRVYPAPKELLGIYQKVVPAPIYAMVIQLADMGGPPQRNAPVDLEAMLAQLGVAMPPQASSIADLDDERSPAEGSPKADSATSGASWEKVDEATA